MNEAKSVLIHRNARIMKTVIDFHATGSSGSLEKKESAQAGTIRTIREQDLDRVVGRSIN